MRRILTTAGLTALLALLVLPASAAPPANLHCPGHNSNDVDKIEDPETDELAPVGQICIKSGTSDGGTFNTGIIESDGDKTLRTLLEEAGITGGDGEGRDASYLVIYRPGIELSGEITIEKTAAGTFDRTWTWDIDKSSDTTAMTFAPDDSTPRDVDYDVTLSATSTDSDHRVSGVITISNTGNEAANISSLTDLGVDVTSCVYVEPADGGAFAVPGTMPIGTEIDCAYDLAVDPTDLDVDEDDRFVNTATVVGTLQRTGDAFDEDAEASFDFVLGDEIDACVDVDDTLEGSLGTVCAADLVGGETTISYTRTVDPADHTCGQHTLTNVASFETDDTGTTGSDDHTVTITVECSDWCSPGFWRNNPMATQTAIDNQFGSGVATSSTLFYNTYFNPDLAGNPTLKQVLDSPQTYGGGAFNDVGSLLSSWHAGVAYDGTSRQGDCPLAADASKGGKTGPAPKPPKR